MLNLFNQEVFTRYKSPNQRIRVMSEAWFGRRMFCPACNSDSLNVYPNNRAVFDFFCPSCDEKYQLKSQSKDIKGTVPDGAYGTMMDAVKSGRVPNFFFLHYRKEDYTIQNLLLVPRFFFSESIIQKRNPLSDTARRAGWTGCNLLFKNLAEEGKIRVIDSCSELPKEMVRESWKKVGFLQELNQSKRGWINDIIWCIDKVGKIEFSLSELYPFENHLKSLHPENNNIQPKIRQQLQILRDKGFLTFIGPGRYRRK